MATMAKDARRRQKALMKKRRKDKQRKAKAKTSASNFTSADPRSIIRHAREYPIHECWINSEWKERGLANILISRRQPNDKIAFGVYLVDICCLGLKNTFCNADFSLFKYEDKVRDPMIEKDNMIECPISLALEIIYGAIDYAAELGFSPQKDYKLSKFVLEPKDSVEITGKVTFGKDGKPFYCSGPDDNVEKIMNTLRVNVGEGNFHFITHINPWENIEEGD